MLDEKEKKKLELLGITHSEIVNTNDLSVILSDKYKSENVLITVMNDLIVKSAYNLSIARIKKEIEGKSVILISDELFDSLRDFVISESANSVEIGYEPDSEDLESFELDNTEISKIINNILNSAKNKDASDIHVLPKNDKTEINFRIDGEVKTAQTYPKQHASIIINKLKNEAQMDISNKIIPQDGKLKVNVEGETLELRISTMPTIFGENAIIRIQKPEGIENRVLEDSGFLKEDLIKYRKKFKESNGLILNVGGTGTGKSTTFAVTIKELIEAFPYKNIVTVEDPVEIRNPKITQIEINEKQGRTFPIVLRSLMRQDPDIILIGEVRDEETAKIAIQAALTGHMVMATLHANDSFDAVERLRDLGVHDQLIGSTASCFLSQVLLKRLCDNCKEEYILDEKTKEEFDLDFDKAYKSVGCKECFNTGYKGREASIEVLVIDDEIKTIISKGASTVEIKQLIKNKGFKNIWSNSIKKVSMGITTLEEVLSKVKKDVTLNS